MRKKSIFATIFFLPLLLLSGCGGTIIEDVVEINASNTRAVKETYYDLSKSMSKLYKNNDFSSPKTISKDVTIQYCNFLILPIWFRDSSNFIKTNSAKSALLQDINIAINGSNVEAGWRSLSTYYQELSMNKFVINGIVSDWYNTSTSYVNYSTDDSSISNTQNLIYEASEAYFKNNPTVDRKKFDNDGDGYLDGVIAIYACPDYNSLGKSTYKNLWAYTYWCQKASPDVNKPVVNAFVWASYDFMYSSNMSYIKFGTNYGGGDTRYCNVDTHVLIHETGHVFGLQDYYDYGKNGFYPAGVYSMQDSNIGSHDPYSVMALGWADPYVIDNSIAKVSVKLRSFQETHNLILLSSNLSGGGSPFDEYILLELYTPTGLNEFDKNHSYKNKYPRGAYNIGVRVWHVDATLTNLSRIYAGIPGDKGVTHAMSNTYDDATYGSPLGSSYYNYNILELIKNDVYATYRSQTYLSDSVLFHAGDTFSLGKFAYQFVKGNSLNYYNNFQWNFTVNSIDSNDKSAIITFTR